nr:MULTISPECIES: helix-turn-helix domain-containing protein [unclassified Calothrix]
MNKQEAADYLGVSVRALERYVQQGKISDLPGQLSP